VELNALTCEYTANPLGIENKSPRLSWVLEAEERGQRQTAYQILVASAPEKLTEAGADLWNTGRVRTDRSVHIPYGGSPLSSRQRCYWKVRVWDKAGKASAYSEAAFWEMGLLEPGDWQGQWLAAVPSQDSVPPSCRRPISGRSSRPRGKCSRPAFI
jgi:alpha-L-rhamnosidase